MRRRRTRTSAIITTIVIIGRRIAKSEMNTGYRSAVVVSVIGVTRTGVPGSIACAVPRSSVSPSATPARIWTRFAWESRMPSRMSTCSTRPFRIRSAVGWRFRVSIAAVETVKPRDAVRHDPTARVQSRDQHVARIGKRGVHLDLPRARIRNGADAQDLATKDLLAVSVEREGHGLPDPNRRDLVGGHRGLQLQPGRIDDREHLGADLDDVARAHIAIRYDAGKRRAYDRVRELFLRRYESRPGIGERRL